MAVEYEVERGHATVLAELASWDAPFEARADGVWEAHVPLPPADVVPPSIVLTAPRRTVAVRWLVRVEMARPGDARPARFEIPVTVAVVPAPG